VDRRAPIADYPYLIPVWQIERYLAFNVIGFFQSHQEYRRDVDVISPHPFSVGIRREVDAIADMLEARLRQWNWCYIVKADGPKRAEERLKNHDETTFRPVLEAARSWRGAKNVSRHGKADEFYDEAVQRGIQPTLTPEEGERVIWDRHRAWFMSPALADQIPSVSYDEHGQLGRAVDELNELFHRLISPEQLREYAEQNEQEAGATPDQPADVDGPYKEKSEKSRPQWEPSQADEAWLTVTHAAKVAFASRGTISRAVNAGALRSNGKKGRERRVDSADLTRWILKRSNRTEPVETNQRVESLMRKARSK
jgi:hypothetical protein